MTLSKNEFAVLNALRTADSLTQRELADATGLSLGTVNATLKDLSDHEYINEGSLTDAGQAALVPYKVDNAIIMAAGLASRCAPLSYERPKGLFTVKGEVLIERQIRQLQEAGIHEIYVVVGYMKDLFFYLEDKFGVRILVNDDYYRRNNTSSLHTARYFIRNSYICSSDNYFVVNPFSDYVYESYFACACADGDTDEWCVKTGNHGRIIEYGVGGHAGDWFQVGEFYWNKEFSRTYMDLLEAEYNQHEVEGMLLDAFYAKHIDKLDARVKKYEIGDILEFDTVDEIKQFDDKFVENMDSRIIENISNTLHCREDEATGFEQIKRGNTNIIFSFWCRGKRYIYRHPGKGSERIIDRQHEVFAQEQADDLGVDGTTVAIDPEHGWKISRYVEGCYDYEYHNKEDAKRVFELMHRLHDAKIKCSWSFDVAENARKYRALAEENGYRSAFDLDSLRGDILRVYHFFEADGVEKVLCHNDVCDTNIIPSAEGMQIIDWEYAGMSDPSFDVATYIIGGEHAHEEVDELLELYFGREISNAERAHMYAAIALTGYNYLLWGVYRQSVGHDAGSLLYYWYRYVNEYTKRSLDLYAPSNLLVIP